MFSVFRSALTACSPWILDRKSFLANDIAWSTLVSNQFHYLSLYSWLYTLMNYHAWQLIMSTFFLEKLNDPLQIGFSRILLKIMWVLLRFVSKSVMTFLIDHCFPSCFYRNLFCNFWFQKATFLEIQLIKRLRRIVDVNIVNWVKAHQFRQMLSQLGWVKFCQMNTSSDKVTFGPGFNHFDRQRARLA